MRTFAEICRLLGAKPMPSLPPGGGVDFPRAALARVTELLGQPLEMLRGKQAGRTTVMLRYPVVSGMAVLIATEDADGALLHGEVMLIASRSTAPAAASATPQAATTS